jgi:chromosome segregation ATPase
MQQAGELREREVQLRRRAERLAGELGQVEAEAEGLRAQRARYVAARDVAQGEIGSLESERQRLGALLASAEGRLAEAEVGLASARAMAQACARSSARAAQRI